MKRFYSIILSFLIITSIIGCASQQAKAVDSLILSATNNITLSSGEAINAAEAAYRQLTEAQQKQVENYLQLKQAKESLSTLRSEAYEDALSSYMDGDYEIALQLFEKVSDYNSASTYIRKIQEDHQSLVNDFCGNDMNSEMRKLFGDGSKNYSCEDAEIRESIYSADTGRFIVIAEAQFDLFFDNGTSNSGYLYKGYVGIYSDYKITIQNTEVLDEDEIDSFLLSN